MSEPTDEQVAEYFDRLAGSIRRGNIDPVSLTVNDREEPDLFTGRREFTVEARFDTASPFRVHDPASVEVDGE